MDSTFHIAIIGGGAAGFFSALSAKAHFPNAHVVIYEKSAKLLSKVKVSGGGRCNVTHACFDNVALSKFYPRGEKHLRHAFEQFNASSTIEWFKNRGVEMYTMPDNCMFPKSDDSQTIINCFLQEATKLGVEIKTQHPVSKIELLGNKRFSLQINEAQIEVDRIIVTTGGQTKSTNIDWLQHEFIEPVPSLFTFNMPDETIQKLMGIVVENARIRVESTKLQAQGPLLVTHWGMSGPAILKLSAWGARILAEKKYDFAVLVNWLDDYKEPQLVAFIEKVKQENGSKMIGNWNPFPFANRLWHFLLEKFQINKETRWKELGKKTQNVLVNGLINDRYKVKGKTTFKEEFVTAGGISLDEVNFNTMESKRIPGMFFAGEILDVDGITGGFNFQAAWTCGFIAGKNVGNN